MRRTAGGSGPGGFFASRRLGQNFLVDRNVLSDIVERSGTEEKDCVLEIGPGQGVLTRALLERGCFCLHAVELDERLRPELDALAREEPRLHLHWGDALKMDCGKFTPFPNKVIANIPYNITTPLIWKLLRFAGRGLSYHLYMVQKEAADRLTAKPDTKDRYPLGVTLEVMGDVVQVRKVPPSCFRPMPRVDSAVVEIAVRRNHHLTDDSLWSDLLHRAFAQRRKTLLNNLRGFASVADWKALLLGAGVSPGTRAEDLTGAEWLSVYDALRAACAQTPEAACQPASD